MKWSEHQKLPMATPQMILEKARGLSQLFGKPFDNDRIDEAMEQLKETFQFDTFTRQEAKLLLVIDKYPTSVLFQNSRVRFVLTGTTGTWRTIKQLGRKTTLADWRSLINDLVKKHGADAEFHVTSDHGDEYLQLKIS